LPHASPAFAKEIWIVITLTRREARTLRGVFRRTVLGIPPRGAIPPLVFHVDGGKVRAQYRYAGLAVGHEIDGSGEESATAGLPLEALADVEGNDDSPITLEPVASDRTVARWLDRGIPRSREYEVGPLDRLPTFPEMPERWADAPAGLLEALAEASAIVSLGNSRYALGCVQIRQRSGDHEVVATDGCQLLIQGGFSLPWVGDVLVNRTPLFGSRALIREQPLRLARTEAHVVVQAGPWTIALEIRHGDRFPDVDRAVPVWSGSGSCLNLDPDDAVFLVTALDRLPGGDQTNAPVTLELNGRVAIRAREPGQPGSTEVVLARSGYVGPPVRVQSSRRFLSRAVRLGFSTIELTGTSDPLVSRRDHRVYAWQPLSGDTAIAPSEVTTQIESTTIESVRTSHAKPKPHERNPMPNHVNGRRESPPESSPAPPPAGLASLIAEAEALHSQLSEARSRAGRLTVALRRYKRHERLVSGALASLRTLDLHEVSG
jgi:hypothetical protein